MKRRGERYGIRMEGRLLAAALVLAMALSLAAYLERLPEKRIIAPVHAVDYDALRRIEMVDINAADARELMELPGVGETLAQRIIAYRDACGGFASVQELLNVPGIGEGKLEAMLDLVYVD